MALWPADLSLYARWAGECEGGRWTTLGIAGRTLIASNATELTALLAEIGDFPHKAVGLGEPSGDLPPGPGWFGWISYDAGRVFEPALSDSPLAPASQLRAKSDRAWPLAEFRRVETSVAFDAIERRWALTGDAAAIRLAHLQRARPPIPAADLRLGPIESNTGRTRFISAVERAIEYIRAGDVYQVNLSHRLSCPFSGSTRDLFAALAGRARPWHGGYFESGSLPYALASVSPELFFEFDPRTRELRTRPMKGTRAIPTVQDEASARRDLESSAKDRAELAMIVDLMRNDLGRVCDLGSVRVELPRRIERHASGVLQSTATISGSLRHGLRISDVIGAIFPAGSVTGAPKIRAMQIIDELEPVRRGPYCGSMIWIGDDGRVSANVMIRTACVSAPNGAARFGVFDPATLDYSAGAGIVSDSDPGAEWDETMAKAAILTSSSATAQGMKELGGHAAIDVRVTPVARQGITTRGS